MQIAAASWRIETRSDSAFFPNYAGLVVDYQESTIIISSSRVSAE